MSAWKILGFGLTAALIGTAADATAFDYDLKNAAEFGSNSTLTAQPNNYLQFSDTTLGSTLTMQVYGGHINDAKSSTNSALNTVTASTVADWKGYGIGVLYGDDKTSNETHQIDNVGGGVDFVALVFSQAVTLSSIGITAYTFPGNSFIDYDLSYMAYTGSLADLTNGVNLANFSTTSFAGKSWTSSRNSVSSMSATATPTGSVASNIWIVSAAVATGDRDDGFKLTTLSVNSVPASVPEPATWAMMLVGFGAIGGTMRSRRAKQTMSVAFGS